MAKAHCYLKAIEDLVRTNPDVALQILKAKPTLVSADDVNIVDKMGAVPLHWAIYHNDLPLCKALIKAGADVKHIYAANGENLLHVAANRDVGYEIRDLLMFHGVDILATNSAGKSALELAQDAGNSNFLQTSEPIVSLLTSEGQEDLLSALATCGESKETDRKEEYRADAVEASAVYAPTPAASKDDASSVGAPNTPSPMEVLRGDSGDCDTADHGLGLSGVVLGFEAPHADTDGHK